MESESQIGHDWRQRTVENFRYKSTRIADISTGGNTIVPFRGTDFQHLLERGVPQVLEKGGHLVVMLGLLSGILGRTTKS